MGRERPVRGEPVPSLTPTFQMVPQPLHHITVELVELLTGIAVAKVATPSVQKPVDLADQLRDRYEVPLPIRQLPDSLPGFAHGLGRGNHVQVTMVAAMTVAVVSQRKSQEGQALPRLMQLDDTRLVAVDGQAKSAFQRLLDPIDQPFGLIARRTTKSSAYRTSLALAHFPGPSERENCFSNQCR